MKKFNILIVGFLFMMAFQFIDVSFAQLMVQEGKIKKIIRPGATIADRITLHNSTDKPIGVLAYLEDFEYVPPYDGSKQFYPATSTERSSSGWISFEPKEFKVPPYGKKIISYTVNVPEDVSGGYYSVMFFERSDRQNVTDGQVGVQIVSRVGSLFFLETSDLVKKIDLESIRLDGKKLTADLINKSNANLVIRCFFYVLNDKSIPIDRGETEGFYIRPEGQRSISIDFNQDLDLGSHTAILTFDLEDGVSAVFEVDFDVSQSGEYQITAHRR